MEDYIGKICPFCKMEIKEGGFCKSLPCLWHSSSRKLLGRKQRLHHFRMF